MVFLGSPYRHARHPILSGSLMRCRGGLRLPSARPGEGPQLLGLNEGGADERAPFDFAWFCG
jgi:hypothetical protein